MILHVYPGYISAASHRPLRSCDLDVSRCSFFHPHRQGNAYSLFRRQNLFADHRILLAGGRACFLNGFEWHNFGEMVTLAG